MPKAGSVTEVYSGGPKLVRRGLSRQRSTEPSSANIAGVLGTPDGIAGLWDLGDQRNIIWGGVDFVPADDDYFVRAAGSIPGISSGTPSYPLTAVVYFKPDAVTSARIWQWDDGTDSNRLTIAHTDRLFCNATVGGSTTTASTAASSVAANTWYIGVCVWVDATNRFVYTHTDTTGGSSSATRTLTTLTAARIGREPGGTAEYDGELGPLWFFSGDLSGAGNSARRDAIFAGGDPVTVTRGLCSLIELYAMQDATGASSTGAFDLTPSGTPTATNRLLIVRDQSGGNRNLRATTSPPTWSSSTFNGRGGAVFSRASSQFLQVESSPITAAPIQVYALAKTSDAANAQVVLWVGDKDVADDYWNLSFRGDQANDPTRWSAVDTTEGSANVDGYVVDQQHLLYGIDVASNDRSHSRDSSAAGTDTTDLSPDNIDRIAVGGNRSSSPGDYLDGQVALLLMLDVASTADRTRIENYIYDTYAAWTPNQFSGLVGLWDFGTESFAAGNGLWGGVDFVPADDDYFARTSGAIPGVTSGTPDYPLTVVVWFKADTTGSHSLVTVGNSDQSEQLFVYASAGLFNFRATAGGGNSTISTAASSVTSGRWHVGIVVAGADNARAIYLDTDLAGATNATTRTITTADRLFVGRTASGGSEFDGEIGPTWILSGDLSGAGNATIRQEIFNGADPLVAARGVCTLIEHYPMEDASGASFTGNFDLTPNGTPTATNKVLVVRDKSGGGYNFKATTSPPTYDATLYSNRGGAAFASASSQFLVCESTPVTAAPFQVYAVARNAGTNQGAVFWLGDKDSTADFWDLEFRGGGAAIGWRSDDSAGVLAETSAGYSSATTYLLWGQESSATSRAVEINGESQGTNTTDTTPDNADRIGLGGFLDSTPAVYLNGSIGFVLLLNTDSTAQQAVMEAWVADEFGITMA